MGDRAGGLAIVEAVEGCAGGAAELEAGGGGGDAAPGAEKGAGAGREHAAGHVQGLGHKVVGERFEEVFGVVAEIGDCN